MRLILILFAILISAQGQVFLEESGQAVGVGNHTIELSAGNLSYNLSESGEVSAWRVVCCNMSEVDL